LATKGSTFTDHSHPSNSQQVNAMQTLSNYITTIALSFKAELKTVMSNKGALLILVGAAVIYPIIYSIAYSPELLREIPVAIVDMDNTSSSRTLMKMIDATEQINLTEHVSSLNEAEKLFASDAVHGVVLIPEDFEKDLFNGKQTSLSSYCDASYMLMYKQTLTGVLQSSLTFSAGVEMKRLMTKGSSTEQALNQIQPVKVVYKDLYNPSSAYGTFAMPAIIIFILQQTLLIGIGLMGGFQREFGRHIHTIRGFNRMPSAIILGKSLTYALITLFNGLFALVCVHHWFQFPMNSDFISIALLLIPFVFSTIFMGISISAMFKKAEHSIMVLVFLSLIIIFLTGFSWPISSLPEPLKYLRLIFPCNIIIQPYLRVREMGVPLMDVSKELFMIMSQMVGYFLLTLFIFKQKKRNAAKRKRMSLGL